jgi:hypothetical protein
MSILFNNELKLKLDQKLHHVKKSVLVLSAFVKVAALKRLLGYLPKQELDITIVARWQPQDLISGASDLHAYEFAKKNGWGFFVNPNMHYKIYLLDNQLLFLGSANLTQKGLQIGIPGNDEASIQITPTNVDIGRLKRYINGCCKINDNLFSDISLALNEIVETSSSNYRMALWPLGIQKQLQTTIKHLWVNDLLFCSPIKQYEQDSRLVIHDSVLLGTSNWNSADAKTALLASFRSRPVWQWLIRIVNENENEFVRFGEIASKLHDALLDDPKPYRKDVKYFLSNLYEWILFLDPEEIGIKKFNHTETLFLR